MLFWVYWRHMLESDERSSFTMPCELMPVALPLESRVGRPTEKEEMMLSSLTATEQRLSTEPVGQVKPVSCVPVQSVLGFSGLASDHWGVPLLAAKQALA
jgi:hypothetical protein